MTEFLLGLARELSEAGEIEWLDLSPLPLLGRIAFDELPAGAEAPA